MSKPCNLLGSQLLGRAGNRDCSHGAKTLVEYGRRHTTKAAPILLVVDCVAGLLRSLQVVEERRPVNQGVPRHGRKVHATQHGMRLDGGKPGEDSLADGGAMRRDPLLGRAGGISRSRAVKKPGMATVQDSQVDGHSAVSAQLANGGLGRPRRYAGWRRSSHPQKGPLLRLPKRLALASNRTKPRSCIVVSSRKQVAGARPCRLHQLTELERPRRQRQALEQA